jgi:hypothetical protein
MILSKNTIAAQLKVKNFKTNYIQLIIIYWINKISNATSNKL